MIVSKKKQFTPITIILETEEEALAVFAHLKMPASIVSKETGIKIDTMTSTNLWAEYSKVYEL